MKYKLQEAHVSTDTQQEEVWPEELLIRACQNGDQQAWNEIVTYLRPQLLRIARGLVRGSRSPDHNAEDLVSEAFIRLYKNINKLAHDSKLMAWMVTVMRRIAIDNARHSATRPPEQYSHTGEDTELFDRPSHEMQPEDYCVASIALAAAFQKLLPEHREILTAIFGQEKTYATIAEELGVPVGTVKSRSYYAMRNLKALLDESSDLALAA